MFERIETNWQRWSRSRGGRETVARWRTCEPVLAGHRAEDLRRFRTTTQEERDHADARQLALVRLAQSGESDAVLTLLTQLVPGLVKLAGQLRLTSDTGLVASAATEVILTFPVDRRRRVIAANLLLDTKQKLVAPHRGQIVNATDVVDPEFFTRSDRTATPGSLVEDAAAVSLLRHKIEQATRASSEAHNRHPRRADECAELVFRVWALGEPFGMAADRFGLKEDTARRRLSRLRLEPEFRAGMAAA